MTLGRKLLLTSGAASAVTLTVGLIAWINISSLGQTVNRIAAVNAKKLYLAGEINTVMSDIVAEERGILNRAFMKDKETINKFSQDFEQSSARLKKRLDEFAPLLEAAEARRMIADIQNAYSPILQAHQELLQLALNDNTAAASKLLSEKVMPLVIKVNDVAEQLSQQQNGLMTTVSKASEDSVSRSRWTVTLLLGVALVICAFVMFTVWQAILVLRNAVRELSEGSEQVASAASQVSASSQSLAQGSSEQAASLEETSASTEEIGSMARRNSENSKSTAELVTQSVQKFEESTQLLQQTVLAMGEISASSEKIAKIIKVIDEIAFQTNILALNAAVEAARAGEAGMGFAVVADEVRNLAQRCAQAAKDTELLIEDSITKSREGKTMVDQTAEAIRAISGQSTQMKTLVDEVNLGSQEQVRGIEQIAKAVTQMEQVTQATAAGAEECAAAAEEMNSQSASVREIVLQLNAMLGASSAPVASSRRVQASPARSASGKSPANRVFSSSVSALRTATTQKSPKNLRINILRLRLQPITLNFPLRRHLRNSKSAYQERK
ncbi:MAG: methyl-accepting chemotaxis protein [Bryobacteraceae bacterium]